MFWIASGILYFMIGMRYAYGAHVPGRHLKLIVDLVLWPICLVIDFLIIGYALYRNR